MRIHGDEIAISYVKENIDSIWKETPVYMHGDYHPGNLIYMSNGTIGVIGQFWITLAVYVAHASLYSIKWAEKFGQEEIDGMVKRCRMAFGDYDNFKQVIPKWYSGEYQKSLNDKNRE